jgi:hypothetical protein
MPTDVQNLANRAKQVRDETQTAQNTAHRVGSLFYDIIMFFSGAIAGKQDKQDNTLETESKEIVPAINEVRQAVEDIEIPDISGKQNITDNSLQTANKTVPGAINELQNGISLLQGNVSDVLGELENDLRKTITIETNNRTTAIATLDDQKQDKTDPNLQTDAKTVIAAINEVNGRLNSVIAELEAGWNTVVLGKLYPIWWVFLGKPFCFTAEGVPVDFRVRNMNTGILHDSHTFDIYVDVACTLHVATTPNDTISGVAIDHLILEYFYEGRDGRDLDTVTELSGAGLELPVNTLGYSHPSQIADSANNLIAQFGGDNTGGGTGGNERYYETVYLNVARLRELSPNDDVEIKLHGIWWGQKDNGFIHLGLQTYAGEEPEFTNVQNRLSITNLPNTFSSNGQIGCYINATGTGKASAYQTEYSHAFKIILKAGSDKIQIVQLS